MHTVDFFIKQEYGWYAVGKNKEMGDLMIDVNLIE